MTSEIATHIPVIFLPWNTRSELCAWGEIWVNALHAVG